jgi:hypothetical protein
MPVTITRDPTPKIDVPETTKKAIEQICKDIFSPLFSDLRMNWLANSDTGAEILAICNGYYGRIEYTVRFLDKETIGFMENYQHFGAKAKSLEGLKVGLKEMLSMETSRKEFCNKIFQ